MQQLIHIWLVGNYSSEKTEDLQGGINCLEPLFRVVLPWRATRRRASLRGCAWPRRWSASCRWWAGRWRWRAAPSPAPAPPSAQPAAVIVQFQIFTLDGVKFNYELKLFNWCLFAGNDITCTKLTSFLSIDDGASHGYHILPTLEWSQVEKGSERVLLRNRFISGELS